MSENRFKKLVLLHSNDMHGDFLAENVDKKLVGGVSMLSGYVEKVRREEENTLYCIAGDMFRGSILDSEYKGFATIELMNMLAPDVATIGNHEVDYGVSHLLFLEKCANFPIINANLHIRQNGKRMFSPYKIIEIDGMKILFIGILTEEVLNTARQDMTVGTFVNVSDAAEEVGRICNAFNTVDIDFTVLLTHIGIEADRKLAQALDPVWGVDVIIGGHSHTFMDAPEQINDILVVQAGTGTDQIGRFDIVVDTDNNCVDSYTWRAVPITEETCPKDEKIEGFLRDLKEKTDFKYHRTLARFNKVVTHPRRNTTTEMGCLFADMLKDALHADLFILGSAMLKKKELGPVVTLKDLTVTYGSNAPLYEFSMRGEQLRKMIEYFMAKEPWTDEEITFFQFSEGLEVTYDKAKHQLTKFSFEGKPIEDKQLFRAGTLQYYWVNMKKKWGLTNEEIRENGPERVVSTSDRDTLDEYMSSVGIFSAPETDRFRMV